MRTAIVILNCNTRDLLERFLPGLIRSVKSIEGAEVIVADNASTDGSVKLMEERFPEVRTIAFEKNHGFTGGYNKAFEEIVTKAGSDAPEYFVLINSDIEVSEGWLEPMIGWMDSHPECGACAPKLHSWYERDTFEYAGAAGGLIDCFGYPFCRGRILGKVEKDMGQYDHMNPEVFWASGACLMVRSRVFADLGGLDERFFAHMEEIDLCWRMQLAGYTICIIPDSTIYHVGGGTLPATSPFKLFLNYRNDLLMLDNNLAKTYALLVYNQFSPHEDIAAEKGIHAAEKTIRTRMLMDGLSAMVYLLTFKFESFKVVLNAHREYRKMRKGIDKETVMTFLKNSKGIEVKHIYGRWIVLQSLLHRKEIFAGIHENDFFKF